MPMSSANIANKPLGNFLFPFPTPLALLVYRQYPRDVTIYLEAETATGPFEALMLQGEQGKYGPGVV